MALESIARNGRLRYVEETLVRTVCGSEAWAKLMLVALLARGHVLVQGVPGIGKTSLCKALASSLHCSFGRIQCTPDLLPADVLGFSLFDQQKSEFRFEAGPIFSNIVLADELNRATPRAQSALLEAMAERQVTVDGESYSLTEPFIVVATQNHILATGTFPLPESQLDRFLLAIDAQAPDAETYAAILRKHHKGDFGTDEPIMSADDVLGLQQDAAKMHVSENVIRYISDLAAATHADNRLVTGISPRGALALMQAAQALALILEDEAVFPDHVKELIGAVWAHRLVSRSSGHRSMAFAQDLVRELLTHVPPD